jgi:hypothetical protein
VSRVKPRDALAVQQRVEAPQHLPDAFGQWPFQVPPTVSWLEHNAFPYADATHVIPCSFADCDRYVADKAAAVHDIARRVAGDTSVVDDTINVLHACKALDPGVQCVVVPGLQASARIASFDLHSIPACNQDCKLRKLPSLQPGLQASTCTASHGSRAHAQTAPTCHREKNRVHRTLSGLWQEMINNMVEFLEP